jgi:hypothetical protein
VDGIQDETGKLDQTGKKQTVGEGIPLPKTVDEVSRVQVKKTPIKH